MHISSVVAGAFAGVGVVAFALILVGMLDWCAAVRSPRSGRRGRP